jgi:hypothetical protein
MKSRLAALTFVLLLATPALAGSQNSSKLNVTLRIIQGVTIRHPNPPAGDVGDRFSVDLTLFTVKDEFEKTPNTRVGNMNFSYILHGSCSDFGTECKGTVDITTLTKLPGGTITAVNNGGPIRQPFVVKVRSGTGRYAGAKGNIVIAPDGAPKITYSLTVR